MLVRDHIEAVQDILQDNKPAFARWPEKAMVRWINFGQMALAKYLPQVSSRTDTILMQPGTLQSFANVLASHIKTNTATDGIALMRIVRNMGIDGVTPGKAVRGPVDRYSKDALEPDWHSETDHVTREFVFDKQRPTEAWISPGAPADLPVWLQIEWMRYPVKLADGGAPGSEKYTAAGALASVALEIPDQYAEDLLHYVVAMLLLKGSKDFQNMPKAQYHAGLFLQSINAQSAVQTGVNPNLKALPFAAEAA
jgi:hypothetical protein